MSIKTRSLPYALLAPTIFQTKCLNVLVIALCTSHSVHLRLADIWI